MTHYLHFHAVTPLTICDTQPHLKEHLINTALEAIINVTTINLQCLFYPLAFASCYRLGHIPEKISQRRKTNILHC